MINPRLEKGYAIYKEKHETVKPKLKTILKYCKSSIRIEKLIPAIHWISHYKIREYLLPDLLAGVTVAVLMIPQGLAYSLLTGLHPVHGLYASIFPSIIYSLLGTSAHASVGPFAVLAMMVSQVTNMYLHDKHNNYIDHQPGNDSLNVTSGSYEAAVDAVTASTLLCGIIQILMGIFQLGFVTTYLSDELVSGFTTGAAIHVFSSQIPAILGIKVESYKGPLKLVYFYYDIFVNLRISNIAAIVTSIISIIVLIVFKEFINIKLKSKLRTPLPVEIILIVIGALVSYYANINKKFHLDIVGFVPSGFPMPKMPSLYLFPELIGQSFSIAIVGFALTVSLAKMFAKKYHYEFDSNQEFMALGSANVIGSFFKCFASSASVSRSVIQESSGGKTQLASMVAGLVVLLVTMFMSSYLEPLPQAMLASIVIVNLKSIFLEFGLLAKLWRISRIDFAIWLVSFSAVVLLDVIIGLGLAVAFAVLTVIIRNQRAKTSCLGKLGDNYNDMKYFLDVNKISGIKIVYFPSPLLFTNAELFKTRLYSTTGVNPIQVLIKRKRLLKNQNKSVQEQNDEIVPPVYYIVIDCCHFYDVDCMGLNALKQVIEDYQAIDIKIFLANCNLQLYSLFCLSNFFDALPKEYIFLTLHEAVICAGQSILMISPNYNGHQFDNINANHASNFSTYL